MRSEKIDLSQFEQNSAFYGQQSLLLTIKSFDLQAIRQRYLASRQNKSGKAGSVERRAASLGGVALVKIDQGGLDIESLQGELKEPRGLDVQAQRWALSLEDRVIVFDKGERYEITDPWFSYIHTVCFHPQDADRILVTSSGLDALFEYNFRSGECTWRWHAWDHGLNEARLPATGEPLFLTRHQAEAVRWQAEGKAYRLITDPQNDHLPTAMRAAFINTARYVDGDTMVITLFHEGSARLLHRESGKSEIELDGMRSPHGAQKLSDGRLLCTNTGGGVVCLRDGETLRQFDFSALPHKAAEMSGVEWLQNSLPVAEGFITIDSNRNALVIFDPERGLYDQVPFSADWAVQDLAQVPEGLSLDLDSLQDFK